MSISAIVLAGGFGTRIREVCSDIPKPMLVFNGYPFLEYLVRWLIRMGVSEIRISTCFLSERIEEYFGTDQWKRLGVAIVREDHPLGTGGAVRFVATHTTCDEVFLCNADTLVELEFCTLQSLARMLQKPMVSIVTLNQGVPNQGAVKVEQGVVTEFQEDGIARGLESNDRFFRASSTGCYFVQRDLLLSDHFRFGASLEKEIIPHLVDKRLMGAISCGMGLFLDYGIPERYVFLKNNAWMLERAYGSVK